MAPNILETADLEEENVFEKEPAAALPGIQKIKILLSSLIIAGSILCSVMVLALSISKSIMPIKNYPTGMISQEDSFTALYFENSENLPRKVAKGEKIDFSFTIQNSEGIDKEYEYSVYFKNGINNKRVPVDQGKIRIKDGESTTISESYAFQQDHQKEILFVELIQEKQKIYFILTSDNQINYENLDSDSRP